MSEQHCAHSTTIETKGSREGGSDNVKTIVRLPKIRLHLAVQPIVTLSITKAILAFIVGLVLDTTRRLCPHRVRLRCCTINIIKDSTKQVPVSRAMVHLRSPINTIPPTRRRTGRTRLYQSFTSSFTYATLPTLSTATHVFGRPEVSKRARRISLPVRPNHIPASWQLLFPTSAPWP